MKRDLDRSDYEAAAAELRCGVAIVESIAIKEAPRGAFWTADQVGEDLAGWPTMLYERHVFSRVTGGKHDEEFPDLSRRKWSTDYGKYTAQVARFLAASVIDEEAAIMACSWGMFQVLAESWEALGYRSAWEFEAKMRRGVDYHLDGFVRFCRWKPGMLEALRSVSFPDIERIYNGGGQGGAYAAALREIYQRVRRV